MSMPAYAVAYDGRETDRQLKPFTRVRVSHLSIEHTEIPVWNQDYMINGLLEL